MLYRFLADASLLLHLAFVLFVAVGGLLVLNRPRLAWLHVPALIWGVGIEFVGWVCPLTELENYFRALGSDPGIGSTFMERYVAPLVYPQALFPAGVEREGFVVIGVLLVLFNAWIYVSLWRRHRGGAC